MKKINNNNLTYSLNTIYTNKNNSYYPNYNNYTTLQESSKEKEILNTMKESLDTFLLNLKEKSSSKNITKEDIQNYYLTENDILNSFNIDLLSSYQKLIQQNLNKNNFHQKKLLKRAYSSGQVQMNHNNSQINNYNTNSYKINNNYDGNINEITNNSIFYSNNENVNQSLTIQNNNTPNISKTIYYNKKNSQNKNKNKKVDYPIKLINNKYLNSINPSQMNNKLVKNQNNQKQNILGKISKNNIKFLKKNILLNKNINNKNIILYIRDELKKIKIKNHQNKIEIQQYHQYNSQIINNLYTNIKNIVNKLDQIHKEKIQSFENEIISLKNNLTESYKKNTTLKKENEHFQEMINDYKKEKEEKKNDKYNRDKIIEEKNNNILLLQEELKAKNDKINKILEEQLEHKKTIGDFKKIMKDVKITLGDYETLQKKQIEFEEILKKSNTSNEELNNKIKELNKKNDKMKNQINIIKNQKRCISQENEKNKSFINSYKTNYDLAIKEKDEQKKEKEQLINEIKIIKKNNDRINNIKINNNITIQNNTKLRETIKTLNKEKSNLEIKCKNLQKEIDEQAMRNKSLSSSILKTSNLLKHKKFYNLSKTKNKSFVIYNINKTKEQKDRINKKKKKFNKLTISNKVTILYISNNYKNTVKSDKNKSTSKNKSNKTKSIKENNLNKENNKKNNNDFNNMNKDRYIYLNKIDKRELFSLLGNDINLKDKKNSDIDIDMNVDEYTNKINDLERQIYEKDEYINKMNDLIKQNNEINDSKKEINEKDEYINQINDLKKQIDEKDEYISVLEKEKNNSNKTQVISDTGNFQISKLKELNKLLQEKCNKLKDENTKLKNNQRNSENKTTNNELFSIDDYNNLIKENKEKEDKINNLNLSIDGQNREINELKLKLLKETTKSEEKDSNINIINDEEKDSKIKTLNDTIEQLQKDKNKINQAKIVETSQLRIEISKLKMQIYSLNNELDIFKEKKEKDNNDIHTDNTNKENDEKNKKIIEDLKNNNNILINKLKEAKEKINKANKVLKKAKNSNLYYKYVSELIKEMKPSGDKETFLFNKLKNLIETEQNEKKKEDGKNSGSEE